LCCFAAIELKLVMQNNQIKVSPDLQQFIDKFEPSKFKLMSGGIEIRGINDIHRNVAQAREIIERLKLRLIVSHNAEMLSYRGFEVNNL